MANNYSNYQFFDGVSKLDQDTFNPIWLDIDSRIGLLEAGQPALNAAINNLVSLGLTQINNALIPAFEQITNIQKLGFLSAPIAPDTNAVFSVASSTTIIIDPNFKSLFVPPPWIVLVRAANYTDYCVGQRLSYNSATGALVLDIVSQAGVSGTYTDVTVEGMSGGALAAIDSYAAIASSQAAIAAYAATIASSLATVEADTTYIEGVVLAGPVVSVNGETGIVTGIEETENKGTANGYAGLDSSVHVPSAQLPIGLANGVLGLDGSAKALISQLPNAVLNCLQFQGSWNAGSNSPALSSGVGTQGFFYTVTSAGTTNLNGNAVWNIGDIAWYNGTTWQRLNAAITFAPVQQGTGIGQQSSNVIKIGWTSSAILKATVDAIDLGNLWNDTVIAESPAAYLAKLGGEAIGLANGINPLTVTAYTIQQSDMGQIVQLSNASPVTVTIPDDPTFAIFPIRTRIDFMQTNVGKVTFQPQSGATTIHSSGGNLSISGQFCGASIYRTNDGTWILFGSLTA